MPNPQVMELSENLKLRLDVNSGESQQGRLARAAEAPLDAEAGQNDEAESAMRKALGLLGEPSRHRPDQERVEQSSRGMGDRFNGGLHRRRFVQDGDVPVTVLRRDQGHELPAHRAAAAVPVAAPTSSRLQRTEAALAAETTAREKAERSLAETQSIVRDLQTKIGHAELTKTEAIEALRQERESAGHLRSEAISWQERLQEAQQQIKAAEEAAELYQDQLLEERNARKSAEKLLRAAEAARDTAQQLVRTLSEAAAQPVRPEPARAEPTRSEPAHPEPTRPEPARRPKVSAEPEVIEATNRKKRPAVVTATAPEAEPEPVKWWLNTKPASRRK